MQKQLTIKEIIKMTNNNENLTLTFIGVDSWGRPTYEDDEGRLLKDTNCDRGLLALCTVWGGFDGEPDTPIEYVKKYKNRKIVISERSGGEA